MEPVYHLLTILAGLHAEWLHYRSRLQCLGVLVLMFIRTCIVVLARMLDIDIQLT